MTTPYAPVRVPLDCDVYDDDAVHTWLAELVAKQIITQRTPRPAIWLLCDGHAEEFDWTDVLAHAPDADLGATWAALCARTDVERRLLVLGLEREDGGHDACLLEQRWDDGPAGCWLALRGYAVEDGIGHLREAGWRAWQSDGPVPEPFAGLLAPRGPALRTLPARPKAGRLWAASSEVAAGTRLPATPLEVCEVARDEVVRMLASGEGFHHLYALVIRGRTVEQYKIGDPLPAPGDELIRWLCGRGAPPDGVATAEAVVAVFEDKPERVCRIVAEYGGKRVEGLIVMAPKPGKPEDVVPAKWMYRDVPELGEREGWIGVAPELYGDLHTWLEDAN